MEFPPKLKKALTKTVNEIDDETHVDFFLIKRTSSRNDEKIFELSRIDIEGEPTDEFCNNFKNKCILLLKQIESNEKKFKDFMDEAISEDDLSELDSSEIPGFIPLIDKMRNRDEIRRIQTLNEDEKFNAYACRFQLESQNVVYFRKISPTKIVTKMTGLKYILQRGKFQKLSGDVFSFDSKIDCIYFEKTKSLLVIDKYETEGIFGITEYYIQFAQNKLSELENKIIKITSEMKDLTGRVQLARQITRIAKANRFDKTVKDFESYSSFFSNYKGPPLRYELTQIEIKDGLLVIDSIEKRETFLAICNKDIVKELISEELFRAIKKESMAKPKTS